VAQLYALECLGASRQGRLGRFLDLLLHQQLAKFAVRAGLVGKKEHHTKRYGHENTIWHGLAFWTKNFDLKEMFRSDEAIALAIPRKKPGVTQARPGAEVRHSDVCACQGSRSAAPVCVTSRVLRVTNVRPWLIAVAAINMSITGRLRPAESSPQRLAIAASTGSTRSAKVVSMLSTHAPSRSAATGSDPRLASTPLRSSPSVRTLRNSHDPPVAVRKAMTPLSARALRVSERTLVSRR
jgi:hypothetical protein